MSEFLLQPDVYRTGEAASLLEILEDVWIRKAEPGRGGLYILSGFGNYNGGLRFFSTFRHHVATGGHVTAFFGGSTSQRLTSRQLVEQMLRCGCDVNIVNRKRIFHTKCYGSSDDMRNSVVVTSGNFTGPGMSQNVESAVYLEPELASQLNFRWQELLKCVRSQQWDIYQPSLRDPESPAWSLLFDEQEPSLKVEDQQLMTMVVTLGHSDTARINATPGTMASRGSQYFWLSKDSYDFFPPLTILNERGRKPTYSCLIKLYYADLDQVRESRVTFEAGNNVDFRLGTGAYRGTGKAKPEDLAAISRISEDLYEIRIVAQGTRAYQAIGLHATSFVGARGKRIGYLTNERFEQIVGIRLRAPAEFGD